MTTNRTYYIIINNETLDLITALNNGVRPAIEDKRTTFVFHGNGDTPEIIETEQVRDRTIDDETWNCHVIEMTNK